MIDMKYFPFSTFSIRIQLMGLFVIMELQPKIDLIQSKERNESYQGLFGVEVEFSKIQLSVVKSTNFKKSN